MQSRRVGTEKLYVMPLCYSEPIRDEFHFVFECEIFESENTKYYFTCMYIEPLLIIVMHSNMTFFFHLLWKQSFFLIQLKHG